jgi:hypothetical protein
MAVNLKTETPDATLPSDGFLFGADSQSAAKPSVYPVNSVTDAIVDRIGADPGAQAAIAGAIVDDLPFTQTGTGAVLRAMDAKLREVEVSVTDFGAVANGSTDDSAKIQAAIDAVVALGGGKVKLPRGTLAISSTINIRSNNVILSGEGFDVNHDVGTNNHLSALKWIGASGGKMLSVAPNEGVSLQKLVGCGATGFSLLCEGVAGVGLEVKSVVYGTFRLYGEAATEVLFDFGAASVLGEATDVQHCNIELVGRSSTSTGIGFRAGGAGGGNFSYNQNVAINIRHSNAIGIELNSVDNCTFRLLRAFRSSGSGTGIVFNGSDTTPGCRANTFERVSCNGGLIARGTTSFTNPSANNIILYYDKENGIPNPTIETGATLEWYSNLRGSVSWTPTVTSSTGAITAYTTPNARYWREGPIVFFTLTVTITTVGTAGGSLRITLPDVPLYSGSAVGINTANGRDLVGSITAGSDVMSVQSDGAVFPATADGQSMRMSGHFFVR